MTRSSDETAQIISESFDDGYEVGRSDALEEILERALEANLSDAQYDLVQRLVVAVGGFDPEE